MIVGNILLFTILLFTIYYFTIFDAYLEDMQETIIQVQDSLKLLTNKTIQDRVHHHKEQQIVKSSMEGMIIKRDIYCYYR
jgi:hypothetical protein